MPRPRLLILSLLLGLATTVAIAWMLALWPSRPTAGYTLSMPMPPDKSGRQFPVGIDQEKRPGVRSIFVSTTADTPRGLGSAWSPVGGSVPGTPLWTLRPVNRSALEHILSEFFALNADNPPIASIPSNWPRWLPDIPPTETGLIAYGGRVAGWPFPTLRSTLQVDPATPRADRWTGSWRLRPLSSYRRPGRAFLHDPASGCVPLIPTAAFPLAVLMWSAAWLVLLAAPPMVRRTHRRRRGRCATCGYDLKGCVASGPCPECGHVGTSTLTPSARTGP